MQFIRVILLQNDGQGLYICVQRAAVGVVHGSWLVMPA
jgi:hypothetical protein